MVAPRNAAHAEESAEVQVLHADLDKLNALTKRIQGSLARLETSGKVVKDAIGPIYGNTQSLQATNTNIDRVNDAIDRLRRPLDVKGKEESIIRAGYIYIFIYFSCYVVFKTGCGGIGRLTSFAGLEARDCSSIWAP